MFSQERPLFTPTPPQPDAIPVIFAFPNTYSVGITSLGYQVIWAMLAQRSDLQVARLFTDAQELLPRHPELLGFSLSWELDYGHILDLLEQLQIPLHGSERDDNDPLIFGGGPVLTANPEPFAAWFDLVLLGDGEAVIEPFLDAYQACRGRSRAEKLLHLAQVPGIYVPSLYRVDYTEPTGAIATIQPHAANVPSAKTVPPVVQKQTHRSNTLLASTVVTPAAAWENIYMVEVVRSCPEMCRFCLASYLTLPFRTADLEKSLLPAIEHGLKVTNRLGLLGASVTQHPEFHDLLAHLAQPQYEDVRLSIASVRTNTVTEQLAQTLAQRRTRSLTIAVESGSERLRAIVNKKLHNDEIIQAAINAQAGGLKGLKLYGMVGIPGETAADLEATIAMFAQLKKAAPRLKFTFGCSTFVPKSHTPFQWYGVDTAAKQRLKLLQKRLHALGVEFRPESYNWSVIQALISRGDRRLTPLLELTRHYGDTLGSYKRAFKELRGQLPPLDFYVHETWSASQPLPWSHLAGPLPVETLQKHLGAAQVLM